MDNNSVEEITNQGLASILSSETPNIVDMLLGRGTEKVVDSKTLVEEIQDRVYKSLNHEFMYSAVTEESEIFLRERVLQSTNMAVL